MAGNPYRDGEGPVNVPAPRDWRMAKTLVTALAWSAMVAAFATYGERSNAGHGIGFALIMIALVWTIVAVFYVLKTWGVGAE